MASRKMHLDGKPTGLSPADLPLFAEPAAYLTLSILRTHAHAGCARRDVAGELRFRGDRHVDVVLRGGLAYARIGHA